MICSVAVISCPPIWMLGAFFETVVREFSGAPLRMFKRYLPAAAENRFGECAKELPFVGVGRDGPDFFDDNVRHQGTRSLTGTFPVRTIFGNVDLKSS
jgi:hypothetical protein